MSNLHYDLPGAAELPDTMRLLYVAESRFEPDWHSTMHTHACAEIFYCTRGIGEFVLGTEKIAVGSDDLIIVNPNVEHTEISLPNNPLEYIVLGVDGLTFRFEGTSYPYRAVNCRDDSETHLFFMRQLLRESEAKSAKYERMCAYLLSAFLILLLRNERLGADLASSKRGNRECAAARRYLDEHYAEPITLDVLAETTHLNKYYLVHTFSREYGITPINYLIDRRIRESKYLLESTERSLASIANELGFSSPSYFSQSFRRLTGIPPQEYRRRCRQKEGK